MNVTDNKNRREFMTAAACTGGVLAASSVASAASSVLERRAIAGTMNLPFSRATIFDRMVFVSGVLANKPGTREMVSDDVEAQCRQVMENLKASVEAAGADMANVLKCTCFLTNAADFAVFNKVYTTYFPAAPPARSTVVVAALVIAGAKVEVDCVACLPG